MITAKLVSDYFLCLSEPEIGDVLTNLKLQKLVYYAQGFHLALYNKKLFNDDIYAWEHGPVVPALYHELKCFGSSEIPINQDADFTCFHPDQSELLNEIYKIYGQFSAWKLRDMTHDERPWIETKKNQIISPELMAEFFKTLIN